MNDARPHRVFALLTETDASAAVIAAALGVPIEVVEGVLVELEQDSMIDSMPLH